MNDDQAAAQLAFGRILRLAARPTRPGDAAEYERCRAIILNAFPDCDAATYRPNWMRDCLKGAAGD